MAASPVHRVTAAIAEFVDGPSAGATAGVATWTDGCTPSELVARADRALLHAKQTGMRGGVEYRIPFPGLDKPFDLMFMHCNARDHTVAFGPPGERRINHLMIEVEEFDDVGLTYEIVRQAGIPITMMPGRHANDHMYSFYFLNPSGWMCEVGWGARPATHQSEYYQRDTYGHEQNQEVMKGGLMEV